MWGGNSPGSFSLPNPQLPCSGGLVEHRPGIQSSVPYALPFSGTLMPGMNDPSFGLAGAELELQRILDAQLRDSSAQQQVLLQHLAAHQALNLQMPADPNATAQHKVGPSSVTPQNMLQLGMLNCNSPYFDQGRTPTNSSMSAAVNLQGSAGAGPVGQVQPPALPASHRWHKGQHHTHDPSLLRVESDGSNFPITSFNNFQIPSQQHSAKFPSAAHHHRSHLFNANHSSSNQSSSRQPLPFSPQPSSTLIGIQGPACRNTRPKSPADRTKQNVCSTVPPNSDKGQGSNMVKNDGSNGSGGSNSNSDEAVPGQMRCNVSCCDNGGGSGGTDGSNNNINNNSNNINDNATAKHVHPFPSPHVSSSIGGVKRSRNRDNDKGSGGDENQDVAPDGAHKQGGNKRNSTGRLSDRQYSCDSARRPTKVPKSLEDLEDDAGAADSDGNSSRQEDSIHRHKAQHKRLLWTPELHHRFLNAVFHLGVNNAGPKFIMQLMNVNGLKRENVASHLQKYRLYLKRIAGVPAKDPVTPAQLQQAQDIVMREHAVKASMGAPAAGLGNSRQPAGFESRSFGQSMPFGGFPQAQPSSSMLPGAGAVNPMLIQQQQQNAMFPQAMPGLSGLVPGLQQSQQPALPGGLNALQQYAMLGPSEQNRILAELQQQIQMQQVQLMQQQAQLEAHVLQAQRAQQQMQMQQQQVGGLDPTSMGFTGSEPMMTGTHQTQQTHHMDQHQQQALQGGMLSSCTGGMSGIQPSMSADPKSGMVMNNQPGSMH